MRRKYRRSRTKSRRYRHRRLKQGRERFPEKERFLERLGGLKQALGELESELGETRDSLYEQEGDVMAFDTSATFPDNKNQRQRMDQLKNLLVETNDSIDLAIKKIIRAIEKADEITNDGRGKSYRTYRRRYRRR